MFGYDKSWWIAIIILLIIDTLMLIKNHHKIYSSQQYKKHEISSAIDDMEFRQSIVQAFFWMITAFIFAAFIAYYVSGESAITFMNGYGIEKILSIDNLFVFCVIFNKLHIPRRHESMLLMAGILGAIILRGCFIWLGVSVFGKYVLLYVLLGGILLVSGILLTIKTWKTAKNDTTNAPEEKLWILHFFSKLFPSLFSTYSSINLRLIGGFLSIVLCDVLFAIDSISCIFAITNDPFLIYTSNIFAILGMRSLFSIIKNGINHLPQLQLGLSFVLILIGTKLVFHWKIPSYFWLIIIVGCFSLGAFIYPKRKSF